MSQPAEDKANEPTTDMVPISKDEVFHTRGKLHFHGLGPDWSFHDNLHKNRSSWIDLEPYPVYLPILATTSTALIVPETKSHDVFRPLFDQGSYSASRQFVWTHTTTDDDESPVTVEMATAAWDKIMLQIADVMSIEAQLLSTPKDRRNKQRAAIAGLALIRGKDLSAAIQTLLFHRDALHSICRIKDETKQATRASPSIDDVD